MNIYDKIQEIADEQGITEGLLLLPKDIYEEYVKTIQPVNLERVIFRGIEVKSEITGGGAFAEDCLNKPVCIRCGQTFHMGIRLNREDWICKECGTLKERELAGYGN